MPPNPIPADYPRISPYLCMVDAKRALDWYVAALDAREAMRLPGADGSVIHAEIRIGDSVVMLGEQAPDYHAFGPAHFGGTPVSLLLYVADVDAAFAKAIAAGATAERPPADQPHGDRLGTLLDPFGHRWHLASRVEEVSVEEMARRMAPPAA